MQHWPRPFTREESLAWIGDNIRRYRAGEQLRNVIDVRRGY